MEQGHRQIEIAPRFLRGGEIRSTATPRRLTIATMNVWFEDYCQERRWAEIFRLMECAGVDVIAFQEVTASFIEQLSRETWSASYQWVDDGGAATGDYGVGILSRVAIARAWFAELPSQMGRTLLNVDLRIGDETLRVATTHLESLRKNEAYRAQQLETIDELLQDASQGVLCGDLNFCASWETENSRLNRRYEDLWSALRPTQPGFTHDPGRNPMIKNQSTPPVRFDRILRFGGDSSWRGKAIDLLGTESLPGQALVYPSDHFGLVAVMESPPVGLKAPTKG